MKLAHLIGCLCLALPLVGCDDSGASIHAGDGAETPKPESPSPPPPVKDVAVKNVKDALKRSQTRWEVIEGGDWIQAYEFLSPSRKRQESLGRFLQGKDDHEYRNATKPVLLGEEGDQAFLEVSVRWTPHHDILDTAHNKPEDYTQTLNVIETWHWVDGVWCWIKLERQNEFLAANPKFAK